MSQRIYFSGGSASGKSTLARLFFPNSLGFVMLESATALALRNSNFTYTPEEIATNKHVAELYQCLVSGTQIELERNCGHSFVSDRCLDFLAYTAIQCEQNVMPMICSSAKFKKHIEDIKQSEYLLFLCPPNRTALSCAIDEDDGRRSPWLDWTSINRVYAMVKVIYQMYGIAYLDVPLGTHEEQASFVINAAKRFSFPP